MNRLIVNADDFGWTDGQNQAVEKAHQHGILNRASLLTTTPGFAEAVKISRQNPNLGVGIHLALNEVPPASPAKDLPGLLQASGTFHDNIGTLFHLWRRGQLDPKAIRKEWEQQIEIALAAGIEPTHLDGHKHVHVLPPLVGIVVELAANYNIPYVRLPLEKFSLNAAKRGAGWLALWGFAHRTRTYFQQAGLQFADRFIGIAQSGRMAAPAMQAHLNHLPPTGTTELMVHPAVITPAVVQLQKMYSWAAWYQFEGELEALLQAAVTAPSGEKS